MSNSAGRSAAAILIVLLAGCATTPVPTPVSGSASDVARLGGDWSGEYWGGTNGRSGTISFHLQAGADSAVGQVTMINRRARVRTEASSSAPRVNPSEMVAQALTITFVHAEGGGVNGRLDPYTDPECNCLGFTTFTGRIHGESIAGTFTTSHGNGSPNVTGKWKVKKKRA